MSTVLTPTPTADSPAGMPRDALIGVSRTRTFFPELEALRGVAALLVYLFHVDIDFRFLLPASSSPLTSFVHGGQTGVDLFFLLSAFLLGLPFLAEGLGAKHVSLGTFAARRGLRILPLYYCVLAVGTISTSNAPRDLLRGLPHLLFLPSIFGRETPWIDVFHPPLSPWSDVWWTLATEAEFYLLLPLLPLALRTRRGRIVGAIALGAYATAYAAMVTGRWHVSTPGTRFRLMFSLFARGPVFLLGLLAGWLYHVHGERLRAWLHRQPWLHAGGADLALAAILVALALVLSSNVAVGADFLLSGAGQPRHIYAGALWAAVLLLLLLAPLRSKWLICNRFLDRLGVLSYSIYLLHQPVIHYTRMLIPSGFHPAAGWHLSTLPLFITFSAVCFGVSSFTFRWIERPFLMQKSRFE